MRIALVTAACVLALSACSAVDTTATGTRARGETSTAPGAASQMPQSPNSLPPGDAVSGPINGVVGRTGTTRY